MTCQEIGWAILIVTQKGVAGGPWIHRGDEQVLCEDPSQGDIKVMDHPYTLHLLVTVWGERRDSEIKLHVNQMVPILSVCWSYSFVIADPRARVSSVVNM